MLKKKIDGTPLAKFLEDKLKIEKIEEKIDKLMKDSESLINAEGGKKRSLVHGDLAPKRVRVDGANKVKFLEWEWATSSENEALKWIFDYGNLRARAVGSPELQEELDNEIVKKFADEGKKELGIAIVEIATIRSSMKFIMCDAIKEAENKTKEKKEKLDFSEEEKKRMGNDIEKFFRKCVKKKPDPSNL